MVAFARDYDNIPLHTDEDYAKTTPPGKPIAPGAMLFMSDTLQMLAKALDCSVEEWLKT